MEQTMPLVRSEEEGDKSEPDQRPILNHRRPGSPAVSVASAVLEWDPSADVGSANANNDSDKKSQLPSSSRHLNVFEGYSECDISSEYGPNYDLEGGKPPSQSGSERNGSQKGNKIGCGYSTPSSTPVPLGSPQYSPVIPPTTTSYSGGGNGTHSGSRRGSLNQLQLELRPNPAQQQQRQESRAESSNSNEENNDPIKAKPKSGGRDISESSTDWEYDHEKNIASKSLSQWQTSGLTKSEIEYQTKKKNGSSTSLASSVLMLHVDTKISSSDQASPEQKTRTKGKARHSSSSAEYDYSSEMEKRYHKVLNPQQNNIVPRKRNTQAKKISDYQQDPDSAVSISDPSSMCRLIKDCVKLWDDDSTKENVQYDVLKKHRDYHLMKIWKQISTVEKLNMQLLNIKQDQYHPSKTSKRSKSSSRKQQDDYASHRGEGDAEYVARIHERSRNERQNKLATKLEALSKKNDLTEQVFAFFRKNQNQWKARSEPITTEPTMTYKSSSRRQQEHSNNIPLNIGVASRRGNSMPYLHSDVLNEPIQREIRREHVGGRRREDRYFAKVDKSTTYEKSRSLEYLSDIDTATHRKKEHKSESNCKLTQPRTKQQKNEYVGISLPVLKELISQIVAPEVMNHSRRNKSSEKNKVSRRTATVESSSYSSSESFSESEGSIVECNNSKSSPQKRRNDRAESSGEIKTGKPLKSRRNLRNKEKKERRPPVGFYIPLFNDESIEERKEKENDNNEEDSHSQFRENCEDGLYHIKKPKKIQDCLRERKPNCYQRIKDRDEFILHRKIDRQLREETLVKEILDSDIPFEDVEEYISTYYNYCNKEQKARALEYLTNLQRPKDYQDDDDSRRIISSKEMRERTARFLHNDFVERQRREAHNRKKQIIRDSQKTFSRNLRKYQQKGGVNVPDHLKLARR